MLCTDPLLSPPPLLRHCGARSQAARAREAARKEAELAAKAAAREEHRRKMAAMREWTEEELRLLDKACNKFPMVRRGRAARVARAGGAGGAG